MSDMLYSPEERIPICKRIFDESGKCYIEVKNPRTHRCERIKVSTFVALILDFVWEDE